MLRLGNKFPGAGCRNLIPQSVSFFLCVPLHLQHPVPAFSCSCPSPSKAVWRCDRSHLSPLFSPVLHRVPVLFPCLVAYSRLLPSPSLVSSWSDKEQTLPSTVVSVVASIVMVMRMTALCVHAYSCINICLYYGITIIVWGWVGCSLGTIYHFYDSSSLA